MTGEAKTEVSQTNLTLLDVLFRLSSPLLSSYYPSSYQQKMEIGSRFPPVLVTSDINKFLPEAT